MLPMAPPGRQNYLKSHFMSELSDDAVEITLDYFDRATSPLSSVLFQYLGNAARRVPATETAFGHRGRPVRVGDQRGVPGSRRVGGAHPVGARFRRRTAPLLLGALPQPGRHRRGGRRGRDTGSLWRQLPKAGGPEAEVRSDQPVQPQPEHPTTDVNYQKGPWGSFQAGDGCARLTSGNSRG